MKLLIRGNFTPSLTWLTLILFGFSLKKAPSNEKSHPSCSHPIPCMAHSDMTFLFAQKGPV